MKNTMEFEEWIRDTLVELDRNKKTWILDNSSLAIIEMILQHTKVEYKVEWVNKIAEITTK